MAEGGVAPGSPGTPGRRGLEQQLEVRGGRVRASEGGGRGAGRHEAGKRPWACTYVRVRVRRRRVRALHASLPVHMCARQKVEELRRAEAEVAQRLSSVCQCRVTKRDTMGRFDVLLDPCTFCFADPALERLAGGIHLVTRVS